jgi:hypothetical protein
MTMPVAARPLRSAAAFSLLVSLIAGAPDRAGAARSDKTEKTVTFIGFSADETKAGWYIDVKRFGTARGTRVIDRYGVVRLVDVRTDQVLGNYRFGPIERTDVHGKSVGGRPGSLEADNPMWANAVPMSDYTVLERQYKLSAARLSAATNLGVRPDPDVELQARAGRAGTVELTSGTNLLGYTLAVATGGGAILGRYRHEARVGQRVTGQVEILTSLHGNYVAVVNRFDVQGARDDEVSTLTYGKIVPLTRAQRPTAPPSTSGASEEIYVRTDAGWQLMNREQEQIWRRSHEELVGFARMMNNMLGGKY